MEVISSFRGDYEFLSNFYRCPVDVGDGLIYQSSEAAYQALKTDDMNCRRELAAMSSPGKAKKYGRTVPMKPDFESQKLQIMLFVVDCKFHQNEACKYWLLRTGDALLVEGNTWGDTYWGYTQNKKGQNWLGKILMTERVKLWGEEKEKLSPEAYEQFKQECGLGGDK